MKKIPQNNNLIHSFPNDMKYDLNYRDKKSMRFYLIEVLINQYLQHYSQSASGLTFVFFPSDPDEFVDQLKLLYFEKVGGNINPMLSEKS